MQVKLAISSPKEGSLEDLEQLSLKEKLDVLRTNRDWKCNVRWEVREGLSTTRQDRQILRHTGSGFLLAMGFPCVP